MLVARRFFSLHEIKTKRETHPFIDPMVSPSSKKCWKTIDNITGVVTAIRMYHFRHVFNQRLPLDLPLIANAFTNGKRQESADLQR